jgi:hypothetical protein
MRLVDVDDTSIYSHLKPIATSPNENTLNNNPNTSLDPDPTTFVLTGEVSGLPRHETHLPGMSNLPESRLYRI